MGTTGASFRSYTLDVDTELKDSSMSRGEFVNEDAGIALNGWLGVYRSSVDYDPRNLGLAPNNYEAEGDMLIIVQRSALKSGQECEDALEDSTKKVLDRLVQLPKIFIDHISDIVVEYTFIAEERTTLYFQGALIEFVAHVDIEVE